jgi:hypothetical protein
MFTTLSTAAACVQDQGFKQQSLGKQPCTALQLLGLPATPTPIAALQVPEHVRPLVLAALLAAGLALATPHQGGSL